MTAFEWNETNSDVRRREAAAEKKLQAAPALEAAATEDRSSLLQMLARLTKLTELGVEFVPQDNGRITVRGESRHLTPADKEQLNRHASVIQPMLRSAPHLAPPPKLDDKMATAMNVVDRLQNEEGVRFFRTKKGILGSEPEGAVSPATYRQFAGLHNPILAELDRRHHVSLWLQAKEQLDAKECALQAADEERQRLRHDADIERQRRESLERGTEALIDSAAAGTELPDVDDGNPLLKRLRQTFVAVRERAAAEIERADQLERTLEIFKRSFWSFVGHLIKWYPKDEKALKRDRDRILAEVANKEPPPRLASGGASERVKAGWQGRRQVEHEAGAPKARVTPPSRSSLQSGTSAGERGTRPKDKRKGFEIE